jgi:RimJ/RimL family protein N-acetyltransferase
LSSGLGPAGEHRETAERGRVIVVETERLVLRRLTVDDAPFMRRLVNEPSWLEFIGDRGVRSEADAREYLRAGALASYDRHGFGLWAVEIRGEASPIGMCGLVKRDFLEDVDLGFAFLPEFWGKGYAREAAAAVIDLARRELGMRRLVAITVTDNRRSIDLLGKLGFTFEKTVEHPGDHGEVLLFSLEAGAGAASV